MTIEEALKKATDTKACLIGDGVVAKVPEIFREQFPGKRIDSLVAGMHLFCADDGFIDSVIEEMEEMGIRYIFPVHCTGMRAILRFKMKMGDRVRVAAAGDVFEI